MKLLAVLKSGESAENLKKALDDVDGGIQLSLEVQPLTEALPRLMNEAPADILVIEVALNDDAEIEAVAGIARAHGSAMPVIATGAEMTTEGLRNLMHAGVVDFIPHPIRPADVSTALDAAKFARSPAKESRKRRSDGRVISFIRSSGGAGATTVAIQCAADLLERSEGKKPSICLIDLDLQFGDLALSLDINSATTLFQILEAPSRLDSSLLRSTMSHHSSGLDVLASPGTIIPLNALTPEIVAKIIRLARSQYDYTIIDMPHAWADWSATACGMSDLVVLVTALSVTGIHRCYRILEVLREQHMEALPLAIVANRVDGFWRFSGREHEAEEAIGRKIDHMVRTDWKSVESARDQGVFVSDIAHRSKVVTDVHEFMDSVIARFGLSMPEAKQAAAG